MQCRIWRLEPSAEGWELRSARHVMLTYWPSPLSGNKGMGSTATLPSNGRERELSKHDGSSKNEQFTFRVNPPIVFHEKSQRF